MRAAVLATIAIALMLAGASRADTLPVGPTPGAPPSGRCDSPECMDARLSGDGKSDGNAESTLAPAENERLADLFLLGLLASLVLIVPVIVTRQRNGRDDASAARRPAVLLAWRRRTSKSNGETDAELR